MYRSTMVTLICFWAFFAQATEGEGGWPQWRGPYGSGVAASGSPPVQWSETQNIRWKKEIPGLGLATPVIWENRLYLLTAVATEEMVDQAPKADGRRSWMKPIVPDRVYLYQILALDRSSGEIVWQDTAIRKVPHETTHGDASWASNSPVTDGEVLIASFGSAGILGYDLQGKRLWKVDLGDMRTRNGFGEGSSPAIHGERVIVNWDHEDQSFIVALNKKSGEEIWRTQRDEPTSWSTPVVVEHGGRTQVIVSATNRVRGYDFQSGQEIWSCGGMTLNTIPSPIVRDGVVYVASGFRGSAVMAIDLDKAKGDVTGTDAVLWHHDRDTPYVPSILLYNDSLYFIKSNNAILSVFDVRSGKAQYGPTRLEGINGIYASPVAADGKVYIVGRRGNMMVLEHGNQFKVLATNTLEDRFDASPAIVGDTLYLRGHKHLYSISAN